VEWNGWKGDIQQAGHPTSDTAPEGPSSFTSRSFSGGGTHDPRTLVDRHPCAPRLYEVSYRSEGITVNRSYMSVIRLYRKGRLTWHPPLTKFELQVLTSSVYHKRGGGQCSPGNKLRTIHQREILDTLNILHLRKSLLMSILPTHDSTIGSQILFIH
jgi:hypothetical protein